MSEKKKRLRILTNRNFSDGKSWEAIELADNGCFFWVAEEDGIFACFPVSLAFVRNKFSECGRELDVSRLPPHKTSEPVNR
jgi:hypothetical protein